VKNFIEHFLKDVFSHPIINLLYNRTLKKTKKFQNKKNGKKKFLFISSLLVGKIFFLYKNTVMYERIRVIYIEFSMIMLIMIYIVI